MRQTDRQTDRVAGYDWLRVLSTFTVVLIHVNAHFFMTRLEEGIVCTEYIAETFINFITRFCVPCFVMLSGAFLLNQPKNSNFRWFYKKAFRRIVVPYVPVCIFWMIYWGMQDIVVGKDITSWLVRCIKGTYGNLWFMPMMIALYLITPVLVRLKSVLSEKAFRNIGVVMLLWAVVSQGSSSYALPYSIGVAFSYLGYFIMGNILHNLPVMAKPHVKCWHGLLIIVFLTVLTVQYRLQGHTFYQISPYSSFFSPTVAVMSCIIFCLFKNLEFHKDIGWMAGKTYYMYLIHTIVWYGVLFLRKDWLLLGNEILTVCFLTVTVFVVSYFGAVFYEWGIQAAS